jgi:hypothetical protein
MAPWGVSPGVAAEVNADFVPRVPEKLRASRRTHCLWAEDRGRCFGLRSTGMSQPMTNDAACLIGTYRAKY